MTPDSCRRALAAAFLFAAAAAAPGLAAAQGSSVPSFACGGFGMGNAVKLEPVPRLSNGEFTDQGADCSMWQTFFYLNWPARSGVRGVPDTSAKFGAPGTTVWETFKLSDQVFLPNGAKPAPWSAGFQNASLPKDVAAKVAAGQMRLLTRKSKVSAAVAGLHASSDLRAGTVPLNEIRQADGNILYDQQSNPVYYDMAMNKVQFDYIVNNGLYNADKQAAYAKRKNIVLPQGAIEVKGAWKVLTATEVASGRFHMAPGFIPSTVGQGQTVTVGLVGMHVFASGGTPTVGLWTTFYQVDNAPLAGTTPTGNFSFYKVGSSTPPNTTGTVPTQVVQNIPDNPTAASVSKQAQGIIVQGNANAPWQYYRMIDTQWSPTVLNFTTPVPASVPLATGTPSTATLMNPVLETYMQNRGTSCLGCHSFATTAQPNSTTATGFSFMFGNAKSAKSAKPALASNKP